MKRLTPLLIVVATLAGVVAFTMRTPRYAAAQQAAPIFVTEIPSGYRDWRLISVAHEEGDLHSFAAVLGNDVAIKAYREGTLPFPDGTIIAALHYHHVPSEENNKVFGRDQSFVPGRRDCPKNVVWQPCAENLKSWVISTPRKHQLSEDEVFSGQSAPASKGLCNQRKAVIVGTDREAFESQEIATMGKRFWPWLIGSLACSIAALTAPVVGALHVQGLTVFNWSLVASFTLSAAWLLIFAIALRIHRRRGLWLLVGLPMAIFNPAVYLWLLAAISLCQATQPICWP
jgi:hypothetical protein